MNKKKRKEVRKNETIRKVVFVSLAIIIECLLLALVYFLKGDFNISLEWLLFIAIYVLYNTIIIAGVIETGMAKKYKPFWISMLILLLLTNIPFVILLILVLSGKLNLPQYGHIYTIGIAVLLPSTFICYDFILDKLGEWGKKTKNK
jgi:hypothetical protein